MEFNNEKKILDFHQLSLFYIFHIIFGFLSIYRKSRLSILGQAFAYKILIYLK